MVILALKIRQTTLHAICIYSLFVVNLVRINHWISPHVFPMTPTCRANVNEKMPSYIGCVSCLRVDVYYKWDNNFRLKLDSINVYSWMQVDIRISYYWDIT